MKKNVFAFILLMIVAVACSQKTASVGAAKEEVNNAGSVFAANCSRCHGETGTEGRAPNLSKSSKDKDGLVHTITNGDGRMPSFQEKLSQKEINAVADWVLALRE